jgi:hypothetical protein
MAGELAVGERRGVETLDVVRQGVEPAVPEVSVVVPARRVDVFRKEETGVVGAGLVVLPVRGNVTVDESRVRGVVRESVGDLTGPVDVRNSTRLGIDAGVDSDLSLLDDLFADLSLLP